MATDMTAKCPSKYEAAAGPAGSRSRRPAMASLGYYLLLAAFVVGAYAAAISVAGARRRSQRADRKRHRGLLSRRGHHDRGLGGDRLRLRHRRLLDQIRSALFGLRPAALLQAHVVLGRPRRLDHVLGVPAVALRQRRRLHQSRAPSRADSLRRGGHLRRWRCSSCS